MTPTETLHLIVVLVVYGIPAIAWAVQHDKAGM